MMLTYKLERPLERVENTVHELNVNLFIISYVPLFALKKYRICVGITVKLHYLNANMHCILLLHVYYVLLIIPYFKFDADTYNCCSIETDRETNISLVL